MFNLDNGAIYIIFAVLYRGVEQLVARWAHNPKVTGSSPVSATKKRVQIIVISPFFLYMQRFSLPLHLITIAMEKIYSICSKLISACLILLGFNSCDSISFGRAEYGTPHASYKISGKVVSDADGKEINGIKVTMVRKNIDGSHHPVTHSVTTNADGEFLINDNQVTSFPDEEFIIHLEDIDGAENGLFTDSEQMIKFVKSDFSGASGHWYYGKTERNMGVIKLTPAEPEVA